MKFLIYTLTLYLLSIGASQAANSPSGAFYDYGAPYLTDNTQDAPQQSMQQTAALAVQRYLTDTQTNGTCGNAIELTATTPTNLGTIIGVVRFTGGNLVFPTCSQLEPINLVETEHVVSYDAGRNSGGACRCGGEGSADDNAENKAPSEGDNGPQLVAEPINSATGNKYLQQTDYADGGLLTFRRFYNSSPAVGATAMGFQWRHSFSRSLNFLNDSQTVLQLLRPDGQYETFYNNNGVWSSDPDVTDSLVTSYDAQGRPLGFTVFIGSLRHYESYDTNGLLKTITDQNGYTATLSYTLSDPSTPTSALLSTVTDSKGRQLVFTYNGSNQLSQVTLPDGGLLQYGYDSTTGVLVSVEYPDGTTRHYVYNESSLTGGADLPGAMTGLTDESGVRYESTTYSSSGQALQSSLAGNVDATQLTFASDGTSTANNSSTVQYPSGITTTIGFKMSPYGLYQPITASTFCGRSCGQPWKARTYDANGNPASYTDWNNNVTTTTYDANGLLDQKVEASGAAVQRTITTTWNTTLRVPLTRTVKDNKGNLVASTAWAYNTRGQVTAQCVIDPAVSGVGSYTCGSAANAPAGVRQTRTTYCDAVDSTQCPLIGLPLTVDGPRTDVSDVTTFSYYLTDSSTAKHGDLKSVTDALGHTTTFLSYDRAGRVLSQQDANGVTTSFTYYPRGWLHTRSAGGATTTLTYTAYGAVQTITDPDNITVTYRYDAAHRLNKIIDAQGNDIQYTLDAAGNRTAEKTYASGSTTASRTLTRAFNTLRQLTKVIDGLNHTIFNASATGSYDGNGNLVQSIDALGVISKQGYDALNRLMQTLDNYNGTDTATKNTTSGFAYDALDRLTSVTDPNSLTTIYGYDGLSNRTILQSPDTGRSSDTYDAAGNRLTHTDAKNIVSTIAYDALNRPISISYADSTLNTTFAYDEANSVTGCNTSNPIGRLTRVIEKTVTTVYCYDTRGNIIRKQQIIGTAADTTSYSYTSADRLSTLTEPSGSLIVYSRDSVGRISGIAATPSGGSSSTVVSSVNYLPFGPLSGYTLGNGQKITRAYDANYALSDLTSTALNLHFARDAMGDIIAEGNSPGASPAAESYGYDQLYRLKTITDGSKVVQSFTYNPTGDRLSKAGSGLSTGTYSYKTGTHWLTTIGSVARTYDTDGNMSGSSSAGQTWGFGYNGRNRLTVVQSGGVTVGAYTYNVMGQRVTKTATTPQSISERYDYAGNQLIAEYGTTNRDYIWMGDIPVAIVDKVGSTSTVSYIFADQFGTPRAVANSAGTAIWSWPYVSDAFGELAPTSTGGYTLNMRFPGQYYDAESGADYNINRYYEMATGRYLQSDPIGLRGGQSTYAYANGNPLLYQDPSGKLIPEALIGGAIGGFVGYISGRFAGDTGNQLENDVVAGAGTGFLAGLTDGASLLESPVQSAVVKGLINVEVSLGLEANRQIQNYGCIKSNADMLLAGAFGVAGSFFNSSAIAAYSGVELSLGRSAAITTNAAISAGSFQGVQPLIEKNVGADDFDCGCE